MTIQRMDHVGIVVDDLAAATAFFVELGLKLQGEGPVEGGWVDRVVGLEGVRAEIAMVETPDGHGRLELTKFHTPSGRGGDRHAPANTPGIRHVAFAVDDIDAVVASAVSRNVRPVAALLAILTSCPVIRFRLFPECFGMQLPGALRSLPSRLRRVTAPQALQRLGRLLVQSLGAAVCCKLMRLRLGSALPCSRQPVRLVRCRCSHAGVGCPV
jgi:catechol 2,3-dioxygenase-like lactoylglutathione lyase family enzyme